MDKPATLPRPDMTEGQTFALVIATILITALALVGPTIYDELTGQPVPERSYSAVVPKAGTAEYDQWMNAFEEANGHPYTAEDSRIATENGAIVQAGFLTIPIAFLLLIALISDTRRYMRCVKAFKNDEITEQPDQSAWLVRTAILTILIIAFGSYFYGLVPHMLRPLP